jgi:hypothetical protein
LSVQALALIEAMPRIAGEDYVFTTTGRAALGHFDRIKRELDKRIRPAAPWVLHDLRRSAVSGLAKIGVDLAVIEKTVNHASGSFRGVVAIYQRHDYSGEKRAALQRWADRVDEIARGTPASRMANVVALRGTP